MWPAFYFYYSSILWLVQVPVITNGRWIVQVCSASSVQFLFSGSVDGPWNRRIFGEAGSWTCKTKKEWFRKWTNRRPIHGVSYQHVMELAAENTIVYYFKYKNKKNPTYLDVFSGRHISAFCTLLLWNSKCAKFYTLPSA